MKKTDRELFVSDMAFGKLTTEENLLTPKILSENVKPERILNQN